MWSVPVVGYSEQGEKINIIIVDSEGMGGLDEEQNHDTRIFSLAVLLSSFFVYNSMGSIDENALSSLSFVTNISKFIQVKSGKEEASGDAASSLVNYMPKFLWVVRDFALQLVDGQNCEISSTQYLDRALEDLPAGNGAAATDKNQVRQHLKKYFPERDCCTMVRPITNEDNL
jgi:hypothetical protein